MVSSDISEDGRDCEDSKSVIVSDRTLASSTKPRSAVLGEGLSTGIGVRGTTRGWVTWLIRARSVRSRKRTVERAAYNMAVDYCMAGCCNVEEFFFGCCIVCTWNPYTLYKMHCKGS